MIASPKPIGRIHPDKIYRIGSVLGACVFVILMLGILWSPWVIDHYVLLLPGALIAGGLAIWSVSNPPIALFAVLFGFVLISDQESGLQASEILYGLVYLGYLGSWYASRLFVNPTILVQNSADKALVFFLTYVLFSTVMSLAYGAPMNYWFGEILTFTMMLFYFPIKETVKNQPDAHRYILLIIVVMSLIVAMRNLVFFQGVLQRADYAWQVSRGRVNLNEILLMASSIITLAFFTYAKGITRKTVFLGLFIVVLTGLVITQSRAYWVSFFVGSLGLFALVDAKKKLMMVGLFVIGVGGFILIGSLLIDNFFTLFFLGIIERIGTLATAIGSDLSLRNRFYETATLWQEIKTNPIIGHGMGTEYTYYNIITQRTRTWNFVHNGFAGLWFKFGIVGLGFMIWFWVQSAWMGARLALSKILTSKYRAAGAICAACLIAETLVANTSNPFLISDGTLFFAVMAGIISGLTERIKSDKVDLTTQIEGT